MKFDWKDNKNIQDCVISHIGQITAKNFSDNIFHQNQNNLRKLFSIKVRHKRKTKVSAAKFCIESKAKIEIFFQYFVKILFVSHVLYKRLKGWHTLFLLWLDFSHFDFYIVKMKSFHFFKQYELFIFCKQLFSLFHPNAQCLPAGRRPPEWVKQHLLKFWMLFDVRST